MMRIENQIQTKSYYGSSFEIVTTPYDGVDFSQKCFIFPGQGVAEEGMFLPEFKRSASFQEVFTHIDEFCAKNNLAPASLFLTNAKEIKSNKEYPALRNLALFGTEVALFRHLVSMGIVPSLLTGHSFGEYAQIVCAGAVSLEDMIDIVYHRDLYSPEVNTHGTLVAISYDASKVQELPLRKDKCTVANLNGPKQVVLSVGSEYIDEALVTLKNSRIAYKPLFEVGRPYHGPLMNEARMSLLNYLKGKDLTLNVLEYDFISSVTGVKYLKGSRLSVDQIQELLTNQLIKSVDFISQIELAYSLGVHSFIELGPSNTHLGFTKSILFGKKIFTHPSIELIRKSNRSKKNFLNFKVDPDKSKIFKILSKYIGEITGYEVSDITMFDNFQEDLGIDSLKKAEIIFKVLEEANIVFEDGASISQFQHIGEVVQYLESSSSKSVMRKTSKRKNNFGRYLKRKVASNLMLKSEATRFLFQMPLSRIVNDVDNLKSEIEAFKKLNKSYAFVVEVDLDRNLKDLFKNKDETLKLFNIVKDLFQTTFLGVEDLRVILLGRKESPYYLSLISFFKSLHKELKNFFFKGILYLKDNDRVLQQDLANELDEKSCVEVLYTEEGRFSYHFEKLPRTNSKLNPYENSVILSIGGSKGILNNLLGKSKKTKNTTLYILGRTSADDEKLQKALEPIQKKFKVVKYIQADASESKDLKKAIEEILKSEQKIDFVFNASGAEISKALFKKTTEEMNFELQSKIDPVFLLDQVFKELSYRPKRILNFSSIVSHFGNDGQCVYSFSNTLLSHSNYFANHSFLHWPPMDRIGMTEDLGILQKLKDSGVSLMSPKEAGDLFFEECHDDLLNIKDNYYLDPKDILLFDYYLMNIPSYAPIWGNLIDPRNTTYVKNYDLKQDSYILDHHINEICILPAAAAAATFHLYGTMYFKHMPVIQDLAIKNVMVVNQKTASYFVQFDHATSDEISCSIRSQVDHVQGKLVSRKSTLGKANLNFVAAESLILSTFYCKKTINYGKKFQVLESVYLDKDLNVCGVINLKEIPFYHGNKQFDHVLFAIEAALQTLSFKSVRDDVGLGVPLKFGTIEFSDAYWSDYLYIRPVKFKATTKTQVYGDIEIINQDDEIVMRLTEVELSIILKYDSIPFETTASKWIPYV